MDYTIHDPLASVTLSVIKNVKRPVALGSYTPNSVAPWDQSSGARYTRLVGTKPAIIGRYQDLEHLPWSLWDSAWADEVVASGAMPLISWELDNYQNGAVQGMYDTASFIRGDHDALMTTWLTNAAAWGKPFLLRPFWENTGRWYPWAAATTGNTPGSFIDAWRHVALLIKKLCPLAQRVWNVEVDLPGLLPMEDTYPGGAYVDVLSLDGYNTGPAAWTGAWKSFGDVFGPSVARLAHLASSKPILLAEVGCHTLGGNKAQWIADIPQELNNDLRLRAVSGLVWFNNALTDVVPLDFRFESDPASLAAFQGIAKHPVLSGSWV